MVMKPKLCSGLVVLCIAVLSVTAAHADEPDAVGMEETVSEPGEPDPLLGLSVSLASESDKVLPTFVLTDEQGKAKRFQAPAYAQPGG